MLYYTKIHKMFTFEFSYSNITEKTHYWFAQPWLWDYFGLLFPPGLYWYICFWWNQWSLYTEFSTEPRRTVVYENGSLFSESISGVYTFNKFSYHWYVKNSYLLIIINAYCLSTYLHFVKKNYYPQLSFSAITLRNNLKTLFLTEGNIL